MPTGVPCGEHGIGGRSIWSMPFASPWRTRDFKTKKGNTSKYGSSQICGKIALEDFRIKEIKRGWP